jgi:hypothetical protein
MKYRPWSSGPVRAAVLVGDRLYAPAELELRGGRTVAPRLMTMALVLLAVPCFMTVYKHCGHSKGPRESFLEEDRIAGFVGGYEEPPQPSFIDGIRSAFAGGRGPAEDEMQTYTQMGDGFAGGGSRLAY